MDPAPLACKVIISQGARHSNSKRHREPRNYPKQPPVMPNMWGKWFRTTWFWSNRELDVDPAPSACKVRISQGSGLWGQLRRYTMPALKQTHSLVYVLRLRAAQLQNQV